MSNNRNPLVIKLNNNDLERVDQLAKEQSDKYGHDKGYFTLGRDESSHKIGFVGEIGVLRFFKQEYNLNEPKDIGQEEMGGKFDAYIIINGIKHFLHIKTGRWNNWPTDNMTFGVHFAQKIEESNSPVILISYLKDNESLIKIEGFITDDEFGKCKLIKKGKLFPGMNYPSRTDNRLTYFNQYKDIKEIIKYLKNK